MIILGIMEGDGESFEWNREVPDEIKQLWPTEETNINLLSCLFITVGCQRRTHPSTSRSVVFFRDSEVENKTEELIELNARFAAAYLLYTHNTSGFMLTRDKSKFEKGKSSFFNYAAESLERSLKGNK